MQTPEPVAVPPPERDPGPRSWLDRFPGPPAEECARMERLWTAAARILGSGRSECEHRLWAQRRFTDFRDGQVAPIDVAQESDAGLEEALAYLEHSRERLLDWGWTGAPSTWRPRPKRRKAAAWTWTPRPKPE